MSRMENALEKAVQMRNGAPTAVVAEKQQSKAPPLTRLGASRTITINSENRLLPTISEPHSVVSEQYRKLKSRLMLLTNVDRFRNLLMVTSSVAGDGKSLTAANLAISMAQGLDMSVLLVDADQRRPCIHSYLGFEQTIGLSDCLQDDIDIGDAIVKTNISKLSVITAGKEVANPLELFTSHKMQGLMAEIKNRYSDRYVIIDTPPLLLFAETRFLAHLVDGVVFVINEGVTLRESVMEATEILKGCPILGVVLNNSTMVNSENSYYGKYYRRQTAS